MHTQNARPLLQPWVLQPPRPGPRTRDLGAMPAACKCRGREPCSPCHAHIYPHALCHCPVEPASLPARDALPCPALPGPLPVLPTLAPRNSPHSDAGHPRASPGKKKERGRERRGFPVSKYIYLDRIQGSELGIQLRLSSQHLQSNAKIYGKMVINKERSGEGQGRGSPAAGARARPWPGGGGEARVAGCGGTGSSGGRGSAPRGGGRGEGAGRAGRGARRGTPVLVVAAAAALGLREVQPAVGRGAAAARRALGAAVGRSALPQ